MGSKPWNYSVLRNFGGGKRDRTADLLHAMQALSQLSYTPDIHNTALSCVANFQALKYSVVFSPK